MWPRPVCGIRVDRCCESACRIARNCSPPDSLKGPGGVICARVMPEEPRTKRAVFFIDGQNLFRRAKDAFGHHHPNYDPVSLTAAVWVANG